MQCNLALQCIGYSDHPETDMLIRNARGEWQEWEVKFAGEKRGDSERVTVDGKRLIEELWDFVVIVGRPFGSSCMSAVMDLQLDTVLSNRQALEQMASAGYDATVEGCEEGEADSSTDPCSHVLFFGVRSGNSKDCIVPISRGARQSPLSAARPLIVAMIAAQVEFCLHYDSTRRRQNCVCRRIASLRLHSFMALLPHPRAIGTSPPPNLLAPRPQR